MSYSRQRFLVLLTAVFWTLAVAYPVLADVSPGDVIDKSNWEKAEGLVPASFINMLKSGEIVLNIGKLNYDPGEISRTLVAKTMKENAGKYAIKDRQMVDVQTGKLPDFVEGLPFPQIDQSDPDFGLKFMINREYFQLSQGNLEFPFHFIFVTPNGFDREAFGMYYQDPMDGFEGAKKLSNGDKISRYQMFVFKQPYDIAGTSQMTWRYRGAEQDLNCAFLPSIRRVRRLTPANRSDGVIGSDFCYDDSWGYDGKPSDFEWKLVKKGEGILPFLSEDVQALEATKDGGWQTPKNIKPIVYGYQKSGWTGAKWFPTNVVWVKRPVVVFEIRSRDPYYNYGVQYMWMDAEAPISTIRDMHDRSGQYWKTMVASSGAFETPDKKIRLNALTSQEILDSRSKRCTIVEDCSPRNQWKYFVKGDINKYSMGGYAKFCQ